MDLAGFIKRNTAELRQWAPASTVSAPRGQGAPANNFTTYLKITKEVANALDGEEPPVT